MKQKYIEECKIIQQNSTYTAEAHHQMATRFKKQAFWLEIIPAICSVVTGTLVSSGVVGKWLLIFTVISSVITAITAILNPNKIYQQHLEAAKSFIALKHDARFLHESISGKMSDESFFVAVENLHNKYNDLIKSVPPTDSESFSMAQEVIQKGTHEPDKDEKDQIK
jgi:hypothetical protein